MTVPLTKQKRAEDSASLLLEIMKTVDGADSGLDADKLQGVTPGATGLSAIGAATPGALRTAAGLGSAATQPASAFATASQGALADTALQPAQVGAANGVAPLGADSKVPSAYLPSYVDDVIEAATYSALPASGEAGKIYTVLDTDKVYRWSGSGYVEISPSPGSTDAVPEGSVNKYFLSSRVLAVTLSGLSTATNAAITAADTILSGFGKLQAQISAVLSSLNSHTARSDNPHGVTKAQVGLGNVDNTSDANKPVSTAQATALGQKQDILTLAEAVQDIVAAFLVAGTNLSKTYDDAANTLRIDATSTVSAAATDVSVTPTGNLASTDAQAALAELDAEKVAKFTQTITDADAFVENGWAQADNAHGSPEGDGTGPGPGNWFLYNNTAGDTEAWVRQTAYYLFGRRVYERFRRADTGWQPWVQIRDDNGNNPRAPLLAGGNTFTGDQHIEGGGSLIIKNGLVAFDTQDATPTYRYVDFKTNGHERMLFGVNDDAETGGNAGSDVFMNLYADDGSYLGQPFQIRRSTGLATFNNGLSVNGDINVSGLAYPQALKWQRANYAGDGVDLNTLKTPGFYDVQNPVNGPWSGDGYCWLEVQAHSVDPTNWVYQRYTAFFADSSTGNAVTWHRRLSNQFGTPVWTRWTPVSGFATPEHFGASGSTTSGAATNNAIAVNRWLQANLPKMLDQFYIVDATDIAVDITGQDGFQLYGLGGRSGIIVTGGSSITISGANPANPVGLAQDQFTIHDVNIFVGQYTSDVPLKLAAADGASGSAQPGVDLQNVNVIPTTTSNGSSNAQLQLHNVREGGLRNCSVFGKYGAYQGYGILHTSGDGSAPVEVSHVNCRASHVQHGFSIQPGGTTPNDDMQGYKWLGCTALAVDRGWYVVGGNEGFGEWFTVHDSHAYFRECGFYSINAGNLKITNNYFLGHGTATGGVCSGVATDGTSIETWCDVLSNRIRLDASSSGTRVGISMSSSLTGNCYGNRITGYNTGTGGVLLPGTWYGTNY